MSTPTGGEQGEPEAPFDPYRFGKPEFPVPAEYAPPGYVPDPPRDPAPGPAAGPSGGPAGPARYYGQAPMPPAQHPYGPPRTSTGNGKATTSMVLGIASILLFWLTVLDAIVIVISVVFGILALVESRSRNGQGRGPAIAGLACATIGAIAAILATVFFVHVINQCGGLDNTNDPGFRQCVQNHVG